jgi:hypothetical protein
MYEEGEIRKLVIGVVRFLLIAQCRTVQSISIDQSIYLGNRYVPEFQKKVR